MTSHLEAASFAVMFMTMDPLFSMITALRVPARTPLLCVRRSAPTLVAATEARRPVVMTASYECPRKTSKCASLATRFSGMERCGRLSTAPSVLV